MTDTRQKLQESYFFFEKLTETQADRNSFQFNLSAFLGAFRSTTLILQKEFDKCTGFEHWYASVQNRLRSNENMRLLLDKRNLTIHVRPVRPRADISVDIVESLNATDHATATITRADGTIEIYESQETIPESSSKPTESKVADQWLWYFDDYSSLDVLSISAECLQTMEKIVLECEAKFLTN